MKSRLIVLILAFGALTGASAEAGREIRGVWLRPPDDPERIGVLLDEIAGAGFNAVFVETFYHGFTISATSPVPVRPEFKGRDILRQFINEGHARGLQVHAWVEVFYWEVQTEKYPQFPRSPLLVEHPEWVLRLKGGRETWECEPAHRFANPAHPEVQRFLVGYFEHLLKDYAIDGLNLDYIRYPAGKEDAGYDAFTLRKFVSEKGFDPSNLSPGTSPEWIEWAQWREGQVAELVRQVRRMQQRVRPDALLSADVFPGYYAEGRYTRNFTFQDFETWLKEGLLDAVIPMAYSGTLAGIRREVSETTRRAPASVKVLPGLAMNRRQKDAYSGAGHPPMAEQIALVRHMNLPGHVVFCHQWILDSEEGWEAFQKAYPANEAGKIRSVTPPERHSTTPSQD